MLEKVGEVLIGFALKHFEKDAKAKELSLKIQNCIKVGELEKARDFCIELMGLLPNNPDAYSLLATVQYELKEYDKCLKSLQEAIRLQPSIHSYLELKGDVLKALDRLQEAVDAYNQAIKLNPSSQAAKQKRDACQAMLPSPPSSQPFWLRGSGTLGNLDVPLDFRGSGTLGNLDLPLDFGIVPLRSDKGIDYRELQLLLKFKLWRAADELTAKLMCQVSSREKERWLTHDLIRSFPRQDLKTIDQLWVHYSNRKFGFSVQKNLWLECGGKLNGFDYSIWEKFSIEVGWYHSRDDHWQTYKEFMNDTQNAQYAISASIPTFGFRGDDSLFGGNDIPIVFGQAMSNRQVGAAMKFVIFLLSRQDL